MLPGEPVTVRYQDGMTALCSIIYSRHSKTPPREHSEKNDAVSDRGGSVCLDRRAAWIKWTAASQRCDMQPADRLALLTKQIAQQSAARERVEQVQLVDSPHDRQIGRGTARGG